VEGDRVSALALAVVLSALPAEPVLLDGVAAIVGRRVITRTEVDTEGRIVLVGRAGARGLAQPLDDAFRKSVLDYLVVQELLVQEARRQHGLAVAESDVDRGVAQFKSRFGDDEAFRAFLDDTGADEDAVRTIVRRDQTVQQLLARVLEMPPLTPDEVRRHILAHPELMPGASDATRERAAREALDKARREKRFERYVAELKTRTPVRIVAKLGQPEG
jgi:hypothetical protein